MTILNPDHLLEQAIRLIEAPRSGPARQVDIRRAMSTSYYALFHTVLTAAADNLVGRMHRGSARYGRVYRSVEHRDLKTMCDIASRRALPAHYQPHAPPGGFDPNIRSFSSNVLSLQEVRHTADYDPGPRFHTADAGKAIEVARSALTDWKASTNEQRDAFLWLLLFRPRTQ